MVATPAQSTLQDGIVHVDMRTINTEILNGDSDAGEGGTWTWKSVRSARHSFRTPFSRRAGVRPPWLHAKTLAAPRRPDTHLFSSFIIIHWRIKVEAWAQDAGTKASFETGLAQREAHARWLRCATIRRRRSPRWEAQRLFAQSFV